MTIPKREAVDGPGFDAEFCLLAELAGLELLVEIPVVTPTDLGTLETMVSRAIEVLSILSCTGITVFCLLLTGDRHQTKQFCFLDADCLVVGVKPEQFSAFGREIPCETTAPGR